MIADVIFYFHSFRLIVINAPRFVIIFTYMQQALWIFLADLGHVSNFK